MNPEKFANQPQQEPVEEPKLHFNEQMDKAKEILGEKKFLGQDDVEAAFGIKGLDVPDLPYSNERLKEAKENGEILVLRVDASPQGVPLTIQNMLKHQQSKDKKLFSSDATDIRDEEFSGPEEFWEEGMRFLDETPKFEWVLIKTEPIAGTEHLSQNLQNALMSKTSDIQLEQLLEEQRIFWKEIWLDPEIDGYNPEVNADAMKKLPTIEALKQIRDSLPDGASLPTAIEVIYDQLLCASKNGSPLYDDMTVATKSTVSEMEDEPVRPIDIAMLDADRGINLHMRRSMKMGRPGSLGKLKAGVPIGHLNLAK